MSRRPSLLIVTLFATVSLAAGNVGSVVAQQVTFSAEQLDFFEKQIRPVLVEHCYECHSGQSKKLEGGLRVDSRPGLLRGGDSGPAITPGEARRSLLWQALTYPDDGPQMPPGGKLPPPVLEQFEKWIAMAAPIRAPAPASAPPSRSAGEHWAFQQPVAHPPPTVGDAAWPRNEIDFYVLARLEARGLTPSADASPREWLRRLKFDLQGLPPSYQESEQFVADAMRDPVGARQRLVERLLNSPQFGERWARHWLDVARYADTKGYVFTQDRNYPGAYKYRDWVVAALNDDLPYDRFLVQQIAADQLPADQQALEAMGFLTLGRRFLNNQHDIIDDRIDVVARGTMGLTLACARCHNHKFDPLQMDDYYALYGVFSSSREENDKEMPPRLVDDSQPRNAHILLRGNPGNRGPEIERRFIAVLSPDPPRPFQQGSGRLELARSIAAAENPLTARVFANRVWAHLFGRGLVRTPSDFGTRADPPSHPELLDHLAVRFVQEGWSIKELIRRIVLSRSYGQQSLDRPACREVDPENELLWRMNRRRLDFETTRDALLAVSGKLDLRVGGPAEDITAQPGSNRRTLYGFIDRQNLPNLFRTFDFASPDTHSPGRFQTTVPQQSLFLLNSPFVLEQARQLAERSQQQGAEGDQRLQALFRMAYGRDASPLELEWSRAFIDSDQPAAERPVWQYGYGEVQPAEQRVANFQVLKVWSGHGWQGGSKLPDDATGWVSLHASGGHPGNDAHHSAIRRWIAPADGLLAVRGTLGHPASEGDGVQGLLVSSRRGIVGQWVVKQQTVETNVDGFDVQSGETLDFVTACRANPNHDSFQWRVALNLTSPNKEQQHWDSERDFRGESGGNQSPATAWQRLAHALLMSNEFHFVD